MVERNRRNKKKKKKQEGNIRGRGEREAMPVAAGRALAATLAAFSCAMRSRAALTSAALTSA